MLRPWTEGTVSSVPLRRAAWGVCPPLGTFAGVCLIPDFTYLSATSARVEILSFFKCIYLSLAGLGLHCCMGSSLVAVSRGCFSLQRPGRSCCGTGARGLMGFSTCGSWILEHRPQLSRFMGLVAPRPVGYSQTRDRTRVSCNGRRILIPFATREGRRGFYSSCSPGCPPSDR